jgi:hypothetical protein
MDWETWLKAAAKQPSDNEDKKRDKTQQQIFDVLSDHAPLKDRPFRVYVKGSYANNTNVRLNFDVDIAVEYYGYFYSDLALDLEGHDKSEVGVVSSSDPYTRTQFKKDIEDALISKFGSKAITGGNIAYRVREDKTTLPADVVPSWEYRRYDGIDYRGNPVVYVGSRVYPEKGGYINNFPKIQVQKGTAKNLATSKRYKRMVRCLKKLQTLLIAEGLLDHELPSYLIECIVFNVPNSKFNHETYVDDMRAVLAYLFNQTLVSGNWNDWKEAHGLKYLFRGERSWNYTQVHTLADVAWDYIGLGTE